MEKTTLPRYIFCLTALALSSCTSIQHSVARLQSSFVDENPYSPPSSKKKTPPPPVKKSPTFRERLAQWAPTRSKTSSGYTPFPTQPHTAATRAAASPTRPASLAPAKKATPAKKTTPAKKIAKRPITKKPSPTLPPIDPIATRSTTSKAKAKPASKASSRTKAANNKGKVYRVRYVPGRPTHILHPTKRNVIVRITDKKGNKPPKGTIMRVPNENIRFYIP